MKKHVLWTILLPLIAACSNSREGVVRPDVPIRLTAGIRQVVTRGVVDENSEFETILYRWDYKNSDTEWQAGEPEEQSRTMKVQIGGNLLFVGGSQFFYMTDSEGGVFNTAFKAISPKGVLGEDRKVTFATEQMDGTQDLMVASLIEVGNANAPENKMLIFEHKLAQYNFRVIKRATSEIATITAIALKSVAIPQSVNLDGESLVNYTERESLPLVMPQSTALVTDETLKLGEPTMIAPGKESISFELTAVNTTGETILIPATATFAKAAEAGKSYLITLEFAKGELPVELDITATIGAWIPAEGGDATFDDV